MKKLFALILALLMVFTMVACAAKEETAKADAPAADAPAADAPADDAPADDATAEEDSVYGGVYGVVMPDVTSSPFYNACLDGIIEGIEEMDPDASYVLGDCAWDPAVQMDQMNDMVTQGVKAFVMIPAGSSAVLEGIEAASKEGIPVCVLDTATTDRTYVASTIVSNNLNAGEISGTAMVDALPDGGKVVIICTTGNEVINARLEGFYSKIEGHNIEVVQELVITDGTTEEAVTLMENALQSIPDLAGVYTTGDTFAIGIAAALEANGYAPGDVVICSTDGTSKGCELVEQGWVFSTAGQQAKKLGYDSVAAALKVLAGEEVPEYIELDCIDVRKENLDAYTPF